MRLEVYVSNHCVNCREALETAERARTIPNLTVAVVNLDDPGTTAPTTVIAVPTYLLDGRVVSLGNPYRDKFLADLERRAREGLP